jgi:hypothetical protein
VGETDGAIEALVGVVISETDLQFDRLHELALLAGGQQLSDGLLQEIGVDFTH